VVSACLYGSSGRLLRIPARRSDGELPDAVREGKRHLHTRGFVTVSSRWTAAERGRTLVLNADLHEIAERWRQMLEITGLLLLGALAVGGIAGSLLQRKISQPVPGAGGGNA